MSNTAKRSPRGRWVPAFRRALLYLLLVMVIVAAVDWFRSRDVPVQLPALTVQAIGQQPVDIIALSQSQPVILYFWASWCSVCPLVSPTVDSFGEGYPVMSIALSSGSDQQLQQYVKHKGYDFAVVNDSRGQLANLFAINATPTLAIIYQGQVRSVTSGITTWPGLWLRLWLAKVLS